MNVLRLVVQITRFLYRVIRLPVLSRGTNTVEMVLTVMTSAISHSKQCPYCSGLPTDFTIHHLRKNVFLCLLQWFRNKTSLSPSVLVLARRQKSLKSWRSMYQERKKQQKKNPCKSARLNSAKGRRGNRLTLICCNPLCKCVKHVEKYFTCRSKGDLMLSHLFHSFQERSHHYYYPAGDYMPPLRPHPEEIRRLGETKE